MFVYFVSIASKLSAWQGGGDIPARGLLIAIIGYLEVVEGEGERRSEEQDRKSRDKFR